MLSFNMKSTGYLRLLKNFNFIFIFTVLLVRACVTYCCKTKITARAKIIMMVAPVFRCGRHCQGDWRVAVCVCVDCNVSTADCRHLSATD